MRRCRPRAGQGIVSHSQSHTGGSNGIGFFGATPQNKVISAAPATARTRFLVLSRVVKHREMIFVCLSVRHSGCRRDNTVPAGV